MSMYIYNLCSYICIFLLMSVCVCMYICTYLHIWVPHNRFYSQTQADTWEIPAWYKEKQVPGRWSDTGPGALRPCGIAVLGDP